MKKIDKLLWTPADWHSGSNTALAIPQWTWGDGITVTQSKTQSIVRKQHFENLKLIKEARKGRQLHTCYLGDAIDGNHHGTPQIISPDENEHSRIFVTLLEESLEYVGFNPNNGDTIRFYIGTESHVKGYEEGIAKYFYDKYGDGCVPPVIKPTVGGRFKDGRFVREHGLLDINGVKFDLAHQPSAGPGTRTWTKENGVRNVVKSIYHDGLEHGRIIPNYWVRAHRHQYVRSGAYHGKHGWIEGVLLPAKQAKTQFASRVASDNLSNIGDVWFTVDADSYSKLHENILWYDDRGDVERI